VGGGQEEELTQRICVCVNGPYEKTNGVRVRELFRDLQAEADVRFEYRDDCRRLASTIRFCREILLMRPDVVFVEGVGFSGILAALFARVVCGSRMILSTGDAAYAFARACMGFMKAQSVGLIEWTALHASSAIIVWGPFHKQWLEGRGFRNVFWIPGGVDTRLFRPLDSSVLRAQLGVEDRLTIGVVGSINRNPRNGFAYGWEIVEVVKLLKHLPVAGIVVGPGDGVAHLQARARDHGIADRVVFTGWVDHHRLPEYVNAIDICISTQSNDLVGQVRITAKVPEYLACGRFIIATAVGGAQEFVKDCGLLLQSRSVMDSEYIDSLAHAVEDILKDRSRLSIGHNGVAVAKRTFDYAVLHPELRRVLEAVTPPRAGTGPSAASAREPKADRT
jgi:glycosyltransferase involved in cell wall biosynthesis